MPQSCAGAGKVLLVDAGGLSCGACEQARGTGAGGDFGQAKIQDLGVAALRDEEVRRLDIAMDDSFAMSRVKRVRNLDG